MNKQIFLLVLLLSLSSLSFSQQKPVSKKLIVSGKIVEKNSQQPLEYATISLVNLTTNKITSGGITDAKGEFIVETIPGVFDIKIEFISFKPLELKAKELNQNTSLGTISLIEDAAQLNEVVVRAEKTSVEIKLDKKVYNVGKDLMVKGGTISDVLDNIPSVAVDTDGTITLRGNDNVRILVDGKPSTAINVAEALRQIPADAIDKVEVITNPSARYDAEGGGGILNIVLKKGKNNGLNGTIIATTGYPDNHGLNANLNYKEKDFNFYTGHGYFYRNSPGNFTVDTEYLNPSTTSPNFIYERRNNDRIGNSYNGNFGLDWFLTKNITWSNSVNYRKSSDDNNNKAVFKNIFTDNTTSIRNRDNFEESNSENIEYNSNIEKKFKKDGHKLTVDFQTSLNKDNAISTIFDTQFPNANTSNIQKQNRNLLATDYVLPIGKDMQFEAGYRGDFTNQLTNVAIFEDNIADDNLSSNLEYKEKVNALYTQYGFKMSKMSFLFGLRWEDSNIEVNALDENNFNNKKYNNFFPSAFFNYEFNDNNNATLSYSRRIRRPRGRFLNPSSDFSSNINIFQGNPDLDPAITDAVDIGYLKKWNKLTFNTSAYVNKTTDTFTFVRKESGNFTSDGIPIILFSPINLATEYRAGFEFNFNYNPYKWLRLNSNFNFFSQETQGDYRYIDFQNNEVVQNLDNKTNSWSTRFSSKVTLPYSIDWQTNLNYEGPQTTAQGKRLGIFGMNLAFSKDILKDKATISLNVSDVFNSRKRRIETFLPGVIDSFTEMQFRERQINLSFTYRFNKTKKEDRPKRGNQEFDGGDFPG